MRRQSFDNQTSQPKEDYKNNRDYLDIKDNTMIREQDEYSRQLRNKVRDLRSQHKTAEITVKQIEKKTQKYNVKHISNVRYIKGNPHKKRFNYLETYNHNMQLIAQREKEKKIELYNQREMNQMIHTNLHKKYDQKIEAHLSKTQEEGLIAKLQREYNQEMKEFLKMQELLKAKQNVTMIRSKVSTYHENKFNEMMKTRTNHIEELENRLLYENQKLENTQRQANIMLSKQYEAENQLMKSQNQREIINDNIKHMNLDYRYTRKTTQEYE